MARLYCRLLKDIGVFDSANRRAQDRRDAADAAARKKAAAAEQLRIENERKAFRAAGLPYTSPSPANAGAGAAPTTTTVGALAANSGSTAGAGASGAASSKGAGFVETTGADLADCGTKGLKGMLEKIKDAGGGVLFVDEVGVRGGR